MGEFSLPSKYPLDYTRTLPQPYCETLAQEMAIWKLHLFTQNRKKGFIFPILPLTCDLKPALVTFGS